MTPTVVDLLRSATALQAVTLKAPWGELVATGKDVENRTWSPPAARVGGLLAIHQGLSYDGSGAQGVRDVLKVKVPGPREFKKGVLVAVAVLARVVNDSPSVWAVPGQVHWCLEGTVALEKPVTCKGALGMWAVPTAALHQVREQLLNRHAQAGAALALSPTEGPPSGMERAAAEAWAAARNPASYYATTGTRTQAAQCPKCKGMRLDYGPGAHAPRLPFGAGLEWPTCKHGASMYRDCMGDPCAPPCCQGSRGAP